MSYQTKQISDKEKIEIMQHYLGGGEVEYREFDEKDWCVVKPSWAWNDCFYRKKIYKYPLYFEYSNVNDSESEKFIVEFTGLTEGTVVQITDCDWSLGHHDDEWFPHTDKDFWREVQKPKYSETQTKYMHNNYICVGNAWIGVNNWVEIKYPTFQESGIIAYKFIHIRHKDVLEAYLKDSNSVIEWNPIGFGFTYLEEDFLESYDETNDYRIKEQEPESQIVYECHRTDKKTGESEICTKLLTDNMLKILQEDDRTQYTYHKTGRSFEIKLGDK